MASSKYKGSPKKKSNPELELVVSSLRNENAFLKKTIAELSRQHSEHNKLLERFLSLETVRLGSSQQLTAKEENAALPPVQLSKKEESLMDEVSIKRRKRSISSYSRETEEIKKKLVRLSTRCQFLKGKVAQNKDFPSAVWASTNTAVELQNHLRDALEKNKQWLEYDQQREAYVRGILARMLWLEKQLNEANQARSHQHNEGHSDENWKIIQMQEHYERLLKKANHKAEVLVEQLNMARQDLAITEHQSKERENEVEELKQQLQKANMSRKGALEDHQCSQDEEQWLTADSEDLQCRLDDEKRRSANIELQSTLYQRFLLNQHHEDQEKIADLERLVKISAQHLEDEKQDLSYLKMKMFRVSKWLKKHKDRVMEQSKRDQQDGASYEASPPPSLSSRDSQTSAHHSGLLNESFLECPKCRAEYPTSSYKELMIHLEICCG